MNYGKEIMMKKNMLAIVTGMVMSGLAFSATAAPVNDIAAPAKGISHNIYSEFNVGKEGVVFNNSMETVNSQLAGQIAGNGSLSKNSGAAKVIIAEVRSKSSAASQLNGMMEVAGNKAELIIANPAGINCNGCGSINTSRLSLVAGSVLSDGFSKLAKGDVYFNVDKGQITIGNEGMKSDQSDFTDIIARAVKVNGQIHAKDLSLITGKNEISRINGKKDNVFNSKTPLFGKPSFALDVSSLGSMYADRITMEGTEKGVGVRNAGQMVSVGQFKLNGGGSFTNQKSGKVISGEILAISMRDSVVNQGEMMAESHLIEASNVQNTASGIIGAKENIFITANKLTNKGIVMAENGVSAYFSPNGGVKLIK